MIVATFHQASHLEAPSTPSDLRDGLRELVESAYQLLAVVPHRSEDETQIVTGDAARRMWKRAPWDRRRRPWAAFVVWERRAAPEDASRAATAQRQRGEPKRFRGGHSADRSPVAKSSVRP